MSIVAEGWKAPARRLLCATMIIDDWDRLAHGVAEWARGGLRELRIDDNCWRMQVPHAAARSFFDFFRNAPNLRLLVIHFPPFGAFDEDTSLLMRTTSFFPHLDELTVLHSRWFPDSVVADILAASNRRVSRLRLWSSSSTSRSLSGTRLDFGGNLRYLRVEGGFSSLNSLQPVPSGLVGLEEIHVGCLDRQASNRAPELLAEVAPTLRTLTIAGGDFSGLAGSLSLLPHLTRLSLPRITASLESFLLPPSLSTLQFASDENLHHLLIRWTANPSLVPASLQRIDVIGLFDRGTLELLPSVAKVGTEYDELLVDHLRRLAPRSLPFKTLEVRFEDCHTDRAAGIEAECERLEVIFCRRIDDWI